MPPKKRATRKALKPAPERRTLIPTQPPPQVVLNGVIASVLVTVYDNGTAWVTAPDGRRWKFIGERVF